MKFCLKFNIFISVQYKYNPYKTPSIISNWNFRRQERKHFKYFSAKVIGIQRPLNLYIKRPIFSVERSQISTGTQKNNLLDCFQGL